MPTILHDRHLDLVSPQYLQDYIRFSNPNSRTVYVDSTAANASDTATDRGKTPDLPYATLATALDEAQEYDTILLQPSHAESVIAAAGLDADTANITVVGMGRSSSKATITFSTSTAADLDIDAAGVTFHNVKFVAGIADLAAPIDVNADDFSLVNCEFSNGSLSATEAPDDWVEVATAVSRLRVEGNYMNDTTTGSASFLAAGAAITDFYFSDNRIKGDFSTAVVRGAAAWVNFYNDVESNVLTNSNAVALEFTRTGAFSEFHKFDGRWWGYLTNSVDFSVAGGDTGEHEVWTVTGNVRARMLNICDTVFDSAADGATVQFGDGVATTSMIGATAEALVAANTIFSDATPTAANAILDRYIPNGTDIGYEVAVEALTTGVMTFHIWWYSPDGAGSVAKATIGAAATI